MGYWYREIPARKDTHMRHLLTAVLGMALAAPAMAADQTPSVTSASDPTVGSSATSGDRAVNTICPVCGSAVDLQREPVSLYDPQSSSWLKVGVDSDAHAALITQQPDRYAKAARANSRLSDLSGSSSGMDEAGKDASATADDPLDRQDRAGALEFNQQHNDMMGETSGLQAGKEAMPESADSIQDRQGRAGALEFNRAENDYQTDGHDPAMSGSSSGMEPQQSPLSQGKAADRRDVDPIDNGRASALEFNKHERDLGAREQAIQEGHDEHAR